MMNKKLRNGLFILLVVILLVTIIIEIKPRKNGKQVDDGDADYATDKSKPRGIRNNNPGNLKITNINWKGKVPVNQNTDGTFEQFTAYKWGVRAMILDVANDIIYDGLNTITKVIVEYTATNQAAYIVFVSNKARIAPEAYITASKSTLRALIPAMAEFEQGEPAINDVQFEAGYQAAFA